ncbi:MAG TPA: Asp-tRNA(Asn)/Glu-tRNA(Gln) amidotransferase subunit GatC [Candidatus Angelobacter sp.]|nr:Asp-tRNA(Asn)/Glu-tRNA(Gln) amidotransferase subunit GatC [Candidatus Angelobacter sp.]
MKVTENEVVHVADLANLELTGQERTRLVKDLNSILEYIDRLNELDTSHVPAMAQAVTEGNVMRADELRGALPREAVLKNAPDAHSGFFRVPRVIEK